MAQVDLFPLTGTIFPDTRIPFQYSGGSLAPSEQAFELSTLLQFVEQNISIPGQSTTHTLSANGTIAISKEHIFRFRVWFSPLARTVKIGTTSGGDQVYFGTIPANEYLVLNYDVCFAGGSGTLYIETNNPITLKLWYA